MEFSEEFVAIQGSLISLEKTIGDMKYIELNNDDEAKICKVVDAVRKVLSDRGINPEKEPDVKQSHCLRKINLFLILNTNLDIKDKLLDDIDCGHIVDCAPNLSKDLLVELVDRLSLYNFYYETIVNVPLSLGVELTDAVLKKISSAEPFHAISMIEGLCKAVYTKYIQIHTLQDQYSKCAQSKLFTYFKTLLKCFMKLDLAKLSSTNLNEIYRFAGFAMKSILSLTISCLKISLFQSEDRLELNDIYDITLPEYCDKNEKEIVIKENFITELLSTCKANCYSITVDVWVFWVECAVEIEGNDTKSLQIIIAEAMYHVCELLKELQKKENELEIAQEIISMFSTMAVKPRDEDDEIKEANLDSFIQNVISNTKSQKKWFKAFLLNEEILKDEKCINCLENSLQLVDEEDVKIIFENIVSILNSETGKENCERLRNIGLEAVRHLPLNHQLNIVQWYFDKFGLNVMLKKENFQAIITELFNKAVKTSDNKEKFVSEFVHVCLQSPVDMIMKMLLEVLANAKQIPLMINILKSLAFVCGTYYSDGENPPTLTLITFLLDKVMTGKLDDANFVKLVVALTNHSILNGLVFVKNCLLPALYRNLDITDWSVVQVLLETLNAFTDGTVTSPIDVLYCPVLVMLGQIMEGTRWNLLMFSTTLASVRNEAITILKHMLPTYLESKTEEDKEVRWLQHKLSVVLTPFNKSYFSVLWSKFDRDWAPWTYNVDTLLFDIMQNNKFIEDNRMKVVQMLEATVNIENAILFALTQLLPMCTTTEWKTLCCGLKQLEGISINGTEHISSHTHLLADSVLLLLYVLKKDSLLENEAVLSCLDYCIRNFGAVMKDKIHRMKSMSSEQKLTLLLKIIHVLGKLPPVLKESCSIAMVNILVEIMQDVFTDVKVTSVERENYMRDIITNIGVLGNGEPLQMIARKLLECMAI